VGLNAGESDVYTVTVTFTVDGSMPDSERECFTQPTAGAGAYNGVTVSFNDGGSDHSAHSGASGVVVIGLRVIKPSALNVPNSVGLIF